MSDPFDWREAGLQRMPKSLEEEVWDFLYDPEFVENCGTFEKIDGNSIAACLRYVVANRPEQARDYLEVIADALQGMAGTITLRPVRAKRGSPIPRSERYRIRDRDERISWHVFEQHRQFNNMDSATLSAAEKFSVSESVVWSALHNEADLLDLIDSIVSDFEIVPEGMMLVIHDMTPVLERFGVLSFPASFSRQLWDVSFRDEFSQFRNWLKSYSTASKRK